MVHATDKELNDYCRAYPEVTQQELPPNLAFSTERNAYDLGFAVLNELKEKYKCFADYVEWSKYQVKSSIERIVFVGQKYQ
jgi:hypothetical protein